MVCRSSVLGIFRARFRMQLYRAGYLKYDGSGLNLFPVDIEKIRKGLVVFGFAPWENMMTVYSLMKVKQICGDEIYDKKRNEAL